MIPRRGSRVAEAWGERGMAERQPAVPNETRPVTGIVVSHTHWDREWYLPFQRFRLRLLQTIDLLLDTLATRPDFAHFMLDGQTVLVEDYREARPGRRDELLREVQAGRIGLGPWYTLPDEFIPSGESLIRNLLVGQRQVREAGGHRPAVGYLPDSFGHPGQLPQILAGVGLTSAVVYRGVQSETSEFWWEAPDGTRLLTVYLPGGYFNALELARSPRLWRETRMTPTLDQLLDAATTDVVLLMAGIDHLPPRPDIEDQIQESNGCQRRVRLRQGTLAEYADLVRAASPDLPVRAGEWRHNRPSRITPGVLSSRMSLKQADFAASTALERGVEPLQALAAAAGARVNTELLDLAWRYLLQNHPHDSICGCSTDAVHEDNAARFRWAQEIAGDLIEEAASAIAGQIATATPGDASPKGVVLFNTLATPRTESVELRIQILTPGIPVGFRDPSGRALPVQELGRRRLRVQWEPGADAYHVNGWAYPAMVVSPGVAEHLPDRWSDWSAEEITLLVQVDLPAGGWLTLTLDPTGVSPAEPDASLADSCASAVVRAGADWLENDRVRVEVGTDGAVWVIATASRRREGPFNLRSEADRGDEYSFCPVPGDQPVTSGGHPATVTLVEEGPLRASLLIEQTLTVPRRLVSDRTRRTEETVEIAIQSRVSLLAGGRRVEFETTVENAAEDHRLRVLFETEIQTAVADAQGQFEVVRRAVELPPAERLRVPGFDEEQEVSYHPQRAFVDVSDGDIGVALLNRGLPEYEAEPGEQGVRLGLTLLRCVGWLSRDDLSTRYKHAGPALPTPAAQCPGIHQFQYAVRVHSGDWLSGGVPAEAEAYVTPVYRAALPLARPAGGGHLPAEMSLYRFDPEELRFSACKRGEDGQSIVLRAYNTSAAPLSGSLTTGLPGEIRIADLAERDLAPSLTGQASGQSPAGERTVHFPVRAHEIITLTIRHEEGQAVSPATEFTGTGGIVARSRIDVVKATAR